MKKIFCFFYLCLSVFSFSQELVLIKFKDKPSQSYYLANPAEMLTQKSLDRRSKYSISLSDSDVPVETTYINAVKNLGVSIISVSKWFNGVFAKITSSQKTQILSLNCVLGIESFIENNSGAKEQVQNNPFSLLKKTAAATDTQITQIGLDYLHDRGYKGSNITIAVLDAGFPGVNTASAFTHTRPKIKGGYNFVDHNTNFYTRDSHGTQVLSIIGASVSGQYEGTATEADFYLYITEKKDVEIPEEEVWWIAAAEKADSLGVDIITSSLGYNTFDDYRYDYTQANLDGKTSFISRGAQTASEKGVFVIVSAGNEGNVSWKKITVPADAKDVFAIGAVNSSGFPGAFSSYGPSADNRIKPDVSALGVSAYFIYPDGTLGYGNGTSYSTPVIAGAVACLLEAYPTVSPSALRQKIRESANLYNSPTPQMGYGIPNFASVFQVLDIKEEKIIFNDFSIYPNPVQDGILYLKVTSKKAASTDVKFFNYTGQSVYSEKITLNSGENLLKITLPSYIKKENLLLKCSLPDGKTISQKIIVL